ncbi:hypothetical protein GOV06_00575, partial [Candidatus Woesearchaeota archaeon]|nr:hypothetical protein [Candidatus Woesearchaeota archaeon]
MRASDRKRIEQMAFIGVALALMITGLFMLKGGITGYTVLEVEGVIFERNVVCDECSEYFIPGGVPVNITISVELPYAVENATLVEYYLSNWTLVDADGGEVIVGNSTHYAIEWDIDGTEITKTYVISAYTDTIDFSFDAKVLAVVAEEAEEANVTEEIIEEEPEEEEAEENISRKKIKRAFRLKDSGREKIKAFIKLRKQDKLLKEFDSDEEQEIDEGEYNVEVVPEEGPVIKIELSGVNVSENATEFIDIDDVPEDKVAEKEFVEVYAIDPTKVNFTSATVTVVATGSALYKCKDWNFTGQSCYGEWVFLQSIIPGQEYTFILTPDDPGYGEMNEILYDDCNSASIDAALWDNMTTAGDENSIFAGGGIYTIDPQDTSAELTLHTSGKTDNFTAYTIEASLQIEVGNGRGWHFGLGNGSLYDFLDCQTNTGYAPSYGYVMCVYPTGPESRLYRVDNQVVTTLDTDTWMPDYTSYYNYTFQVNSSGVYFFVNNTLILNSTDTTYSQGYITISTGGGSSNRGRIYVNNVWYYEEITNQAPTTPTSIECDGGSCNASFNNNVDINCSGSTDAEADAITYSIEAAYSEPFTTNDLEAGTITKSIGAGAAQTDVYIINANNRDAYSLTGTTDINGYLGTDDLVGLSGASYAESAVSFNLTMPSGSEIQSAYLNVTAAATRLGASFNPIIRVEESNGASVG